MLLFLENSHRIQLCRCGPVGPTEPHEKRDDVSLTRTGTCDSGSQFRGRGKHSGVRTPDKEEERNDTGAEGGWKGSACREWQGH